MTLTLVPPGALPADQSVQSEHQMELDPVPQVVSTARAFVGQHVPTLDPETHDAVVLLTSELVTNVVIHARTTLRVGVVVTAGAVLVTVHDLDLGGTEAVPSLREGGRGLLLVEAMSEESGMHYGTDGGKTAWFRVARSQAEERAR